MITFLNLSPGSGLGQSTPSKLLAFGLGSGLRDLRLDADLGTVGLAGYPVALQKGSEISVAVGSYDAIGSDIKMLNNKVLDTVTGSYASSGSDIDLLLVRELGAVSGVFAVSGNSADLLSTKSLTVDTGNYTLVGNVLTLSTVLLVKELEASVGGFTTSGQDVELTFNRALVIETGSYMVSGNDVGYGEITRKYKRINGVSIYSVLSELPNVPAGVTAADAGAGANELWKTLGHQVLPDNVLMIG